MIKASAAAAYQMTHALSFDIEDWFHILGMHSLEDTAAWNGFQSIVAATRRPLLCSHCVLCIFAV